MILWIKLLQFGQKLYEGTNRTEVVPFQKLLLKTIYATAAGTHILEE